MRKLFTENGLEAFRIYLRRLNVKFTEDTITWLGAHPEFPNLFSISHALNKLGVEHVAVKPSYNELQNELPKPLLVHIYDNGGMYMVLEQADSDNVYFINEQDQLETKRKTDFLRSWSGIAMVASNHSQAKEENFRLNKLKDILHGLRYPLAVLGLALLIFTSVLFDHASFDVLRIIFIMTKATGLAISVLLIIQLFDKNNPFVQKICATQKSKSNCSDILNSKAAYIFGLFSWSEIGLIYFSTLFIFSIIPLHQSGVLILSITALLASPYTMYSIFYQWKIAQNWCKLCLMIQAILLTELVLAIIFFKSSFKIVTPSWNSVLPLLGFFLLNVAVYSLLKPMIKNGLGLRKQITKLNRVKFDRNVFELLLNKSTLVNSSQITPVAFGNQQASVKLTIITNPVCKPCIETHQKLFELLKSKERLLINEIFFTEFDVNDPSNKMAKLMLQIEEAMDSEVVQQAYKEYYLEPDKSEIWINKYSAKVTGDNMSIDRLNSHIKWCHKNGFRSTPVILFNDRLLPDSYSVDDLDYLID